MASLPVEVDDVHAAAARLHGVVRRTPVLTSRTLDELVGASVFLKAECFQRAVSFKLRGAYNAVASIPDAVRDQGVVTFSSGNHAQGLARAAQLHGVPATIVTDSAGRVVLTCWDAPSISEVRKLLWKSELH